LSVFLKAALAALFFILTACSSSNDAVPADQLPVDHLPAQLTPLSYNVELYLQTRKDEFTGHVEIDIDVLQPIDRLWLHGAQLRVGTVQAVGGTIASGEWRQHTAEGLASIVFDRTLPVGRSKLILDYSAPYSPGLKGFIRSRDKSTYIASLGDGGARYVLPGFDEPRYRTPVSLSFDVPASVDVLASSPEASRTDLENQRRVVRFTPSPALPLGALGWVMGELPEPTSGAVNGIPVAGYGVEINPWLAGLKALAERGAQAYPFAKLDVVKLANLPETNNAVGLLVNPSASIEAQAQQLAAHWFEHAGAYSNWQTQCVARGMAQWAGLDAYRAAGRLDESVARAAWRRARELARYPLGPMCWDVPSDKVLAVEESEDQALVVGALLGLEDAVGRDKLATTLWSDWRANRDTPRAVQDLPMPVYQQVYSLLQEGRLLPHRCKVACDYRDAPEESVTLEGAKSNPTALDIVQWRALAANPEMAAFLDGIAAAEDANLVGMRLAKYGEAWTVAMAMKMAGDFDPWSSYLRQLSAEAEAQDVRMAALYALAESDDIRVVTWFQQLFLNRVLPPAQSDALFARLMQSPQADLQLRWLSSNRDKVMRKLTPAQRVHWLDALSALCSPSALALVKEAMTSAAPLIYRGEARLQRVISNIEQCYAAH
jgi:hypothetical protein